MAVNQKTWTYGSQLGQDVSGGTDITGFDVEAVDGSIGKIDRATYDVGSSYLVVDTGPWIFGKKVMLPAGVVQQIDLRNEKIFVTRTKGEIKAAPEFDQSRHQDPSYRSEVSSYYESRI